VLGAASLAFVLLPVGLDRPFLGRPMVPRRYVVRALDPIGLWDDFPQKLNEQGQVLGYYRPECDHSTAPDAGHFHSYLTRPNQPIHPETDDLNSICGANFQAKGLNNRGQVVGIIRDPNDQSGRSESGTRAILVDGRRMIDLGALPETHFLLMSTDPPFDTNHQEQGVLAFDINDRGQVAGTQVGLGVNAERRTFRTAAGRIIDENAFDLEAYHGQRDYGHLDVSQRRAIQSQAPFWMHQVDPSINDRGQVIGTYFDLRPESLAQLPTWNRAIHGFRTAPDRPINPETDDLGFLIRGGRSWTHPRAINLHGQVIGDSGGRAFRTAPNRPINPATDDLGPGVVWGINDAGWVVGGLDASAALGDGFLDDGVRRYNLNDLIAPDSGWRIRAARGINNRGQIIAAGSRAGSPTQGVLLDPVPDYNPFYCLLTGTMLSGLCQAARRRDKTRDPRELG
jgi:uncharacterized membrane protein